MFTTGSKLLFGGGTVAAVGAVLYGVLVAGALGTVGLTFAAAVLWLLGGISAVTRDANASSMDVDALHYTAAAAPAPSASMWPAVGALGVVLLAVGLVTYQVVVVFGLIALVAAGAEWMVQAWSERVSDDAGRNAGIRGRLAHPLEFPVLAAVGVAVLVYSFSRIMLVLSKTGGPVAFGLIALAVLVAGFIVAVKPTLKTGMIGAVAAVGALGLVAGGIASALEGERDIEVHETTGGLAEHGECATAEETHADENASQSVAAKANVTGEVTLRSDGTLVARSLGIAGTADSIVVTRNNPTNILFRNDSDEARRLVLDAGLRYEDPTDTSSEQVPAQHCTALVEKGGTQLLTFTIANTSAAQDAPMTFSIPGLDAASVEVVVP